MNNKYYLYNYSIRWEFGLVFFIGSCFYWVWDSMSSSSSSSQDGERLSAYSVFNKGVTALPGKPPYASRVDACKHAGG